MNATNAFAQMSTEELVDRLMLANEIYRAGEQDIRPNDAMSDALYDEGIDELNRRDPSHKYLLKPEVEPDFGAGKIVHERPMLSTDKKYTEEEMGRWVQKVQDSARAVGIDDNVILRVTAKLDGMAARKNGEVIASRGDGLIGNVISHLLGYGLHCTGDGDGEIVISKSYFDEILSDKFEHPRNFVTGAVSADTLSEEAKTAFEEKAIQLVTYSTMKAVRVDVSEFVSKLAEIRSEIMSDCDYPTDGLIVEVEDQSVRDYMGSTSKFHNWMIAVKEKGEKATTYITGVTWQVGRTLRLSPVAHIQPVYLSGATISNVTAHNAAFVKQHGIGVGAKALITRSGEVIPSILLILKGSYEVDVPEECPCCKSKTYMNGEYLFCSNNECPDALAMQINHFFGTLQTIDLFGPKACEKLVSAGIRKPSEVISLTQRDYVAMGFGEGQAENLVKEIQKAKGIAIQDFKLLAAFGVHHLGRGDAKKLLKVYDISEVHGISREDISSIKGFGSVTSDSISKALPEIKAEIEKWIEFFGESIVKTPRVMASDIKNSAIAGMSFVFTGAMSRSREAMGDHCASKGGVVQSSPNKKTTYLVIGEKVGKAKLDKASQLGISIITEAEYFELAGE